MNNLLLMDATADAVSLTDSRNPAPESIQVLIRTQEITVPDEADDEAADCSGGDPDHLLGPGGPDVQGPLVRRHRPVRRKGLIGHG